MYICIKNNMKVIINVGLPASGKSTYTEKWLFEHPDYIRVSKDSFRYMLRNEKFCERSIEKMISEIEINTIKIAIENNLNVIVDDTNVNMYFLNVLIKQIRTIASITFNVFDVDVDICIERDKLREKTVGSDVILNLNKEFKKLKNNFIFNEINDIDNI